MMKSIAFLLFLAASVSAQRNQGFTNRGGDSVTLRSVRVDDGEVDTQFYDFRTRPVARVRLRRFEGEVSDGDASGTSTNIRLEFVSVIEFEELNGVPGFQSDGNDTIVQQFDLRRGLNEGSIWKPINSSVEEVDGVDLYTVVGELESEQLRLEMFGSDEEYAVDTSRFGLVNRTSSITFSPDEIHVALTLYTGLFDQPVQNNTMITLVANVVRSEEGEASFMPGGDRSSGPESSDEDDETDTEDDLTPDEGEGTPDEGEEGVTPGEEGDSPPGEGGEGEGEGEDMTPDGGENEGEQELLQDEGEGEGEEGEGEEEQVPAPSTDEETTPTDDEDDTTSDDETSSDEGREGGGREDRDIEFDLAADEPLYFITWDDEITVVLNDGTELEVDVITTMENDPEDLGPENRRDVDRDEDEIVTRAYYTFDITMLDDVDFFVWDPEVGADYSRLANISPASTLSLAGAWLYVSAFAVGTWAAAI